MVIGHAKIKQIIKLYYLIFSLFWLCCFACFLKTSLAASFCTYASMWSYLRFSLFVLSRLLIHLYLAYLFPISSKIIELFNLPYYTIVIILLGFISGYPNGAKCPRDMFDQALDSRQQVKSCLG